MKRFFKETLGWFLLPFLLILDPEFRAYWKRVHQLP